MGLQKGTVPCSFAFFSHRALFRTRFAQDIALNCKLHLILVVWGLSRASLGTFLGALGGHRALQFCIFWHRELFRTRFAQDIASNCKLQLILVVWGLSRASLGASLRALGGHRALQFRFFLAPSAV